MQPAGRHLRGARHQARALREARLHPPAPLLQRAARAHPGARARAHPRPARQRASRQSFRPQRVRRLLPARPLAARALRRRPAADRAVPRRPLLASATSSRSATRAGTRSTTSPASPASTGRRSRSSPPPGSRRSRSSGARPPSPCRPASTPTAGRRTASRPSSSCTRARPAATTTGSSQPQPEAGFALLPDPSPGDLFFDFEGNPFWDADGSLEYLWGILDVDGNFEPLHAHDHETERIAFETLRRPRARAARALPRPARLPLRRPTRSPRSSG